MKAQLKGIDANTTDFESFRPEDPERFGFWMNASIGSDESEGADDFQVFVCNQAWLDGRHARSLSASDRHLLVGAPYDALAIRTALEERVGQCSGGTWPDVVAQVSNFAVWEFENYEL